MLTSIAGLEGWDGEVFAEPLGCTSDQALEFCCSGFQRDTESESWPSYKDWGSICCTHFVIIMCLKIAGFGRRAELAVPGGGWVGFKMWASGQGQVSNLTSAKLLSYTWNSARVRSIPSAALEGGWKEHKAQPRDPCHRSTSLGCSAGSVPCAGRHRCGSWAVFVLRPSLTHSPTHRSLMFHCASCRGLPKSEAWPQMVFCRRVLN